MLNTSHETAFIQLSFFIKDSIVFFWHNVEQLGYEPESAYGETSPETEKLGRFCASGSPLAGDFPVVSQVRCTYKSSSSVEFHQVLSEGDYSIEMGLWALSALTLLWCLPCFMWKYGKAVVLGQAL